MLKVLPLFLLLVSAVPSAWPHGDVHGQIVELTQQIEKEPRNTELYLRRGELHRVHTDWDAANADFDRALILDPSLAIANFLRGRLFFEAGWLWSAKGALDHFIAGHTNHVEALTIRARTLVKLGQRLAGAQDYTRAIASSAQPGPELFLERAEALSGEGEAHLEESLRGLDEGVQRLGPLITLELYAIDVEVRMKRIDAAVKRLDRTVEKLPRKETLLAKRGEILQQAGRKEEAAASFKAALNAMSTLPPTRRNVPAMIELEKRIRASLAETTGSGTPPNK